MKQFRDRRIAVVLIMMVLALVAFSALAIALERGMLDGFDQKIFHSFRETGAPSDPWGPPWFEETIVEITAIGGYPIIVLTMSVAIIVLLLLDLRAGALLLFGSIATGSAASTVLKIVFDRSRPDIVDPLDRTFTASFPSGHAMISMLAWMTMASIASCYIPHRGVRNFLIWFAFFLTITIGVSRIYLGVHWPSDVLAGWALGIVWAGTFWLIAHLKIGGRHEPVY